MGMVIYADVLLAVNMYINYFLVRVTALILRRKLSPLRCVLASAVGAAGSLVIFLPELHPVLSVLIKTVLGFFVTLVMFGRQKRTDLLLSLLCFLAVSFAFAGGMLALWTFAAPFGMFYGNGCAYFDIPVGAAAVITAVVYGGFRLVKFITDRRRPPPHTRVTVRGNGTAVSLDGLADTGNSLRDSFSGKPVVLASLEAVRPIVPQYVLNYLSGSTGDIAGIRLVPCRTVLSDGVIPTFPAEIIIDGKRADALLGISKQDITGAQCIFDPCIII